jgi:hypothetical protein
VDHLPPLLVKLGIAIEIILNHMKDYHSQDLDAPSISEFDLT